MAMTEEPGADRRLLRRRIVRLRLVIVVLLPALFASCVFLAYYTEPATTYNDYASAYLSDAGYETALGVTGLNEDAFLLAYGKPERTERICEPAIDRTLIRMYYPCFTLDCVVDDSGRTFEKSGRKRLQLIRFIITSSSLRFGKDAIGVGSAKADVRRAFSRDEVSREDTFELYSDDFDFPLHDGFLADRCANVFFSYDAQDRVTYMVYCLPVL